MATDNGTVNWPASTSTNPSIGTNGSVAPSSSTEVGGIGADGNLHPLSTTNTGVLNVNISSTTTNPLPVTDAAAETSLSSIDTKTPSLGQKVMTGSVPVVVASDQTVPISAASLPLPSGAATSANQTNGTQKGQVVDALGNVQPSGDVAARKIFVQPTDGTNTATYTAAGETKVSVTQPLPAGTNVIGSAKVTDGTNTAAVKAASTAPVATDPALVVTVSPNTADPAIGSAGAGTAGSKSYLTGGVYNTALPTLTTGQQAAFQLDSSGRQIISPLTNSSSVKAQLQDNSGTAVTVGQKTMASSLPVAIASDQSAVPSSQSGTWTVQPGNTANTTPWLVTEQVASSSSVTSVAGSATSVVLLASNASRKGAMFYNESTAVLYLKLGTTASATSYTVQLGPNAYYELPPAHIYTGEIDGIWASAAGNVRITELS